MGIVYILTNPVMPDLVKIGRTESTVEERVRALNSVPGVPLPFEEQEALDRERSREVNFSFGSVHIRPGAALHSVFDDEVTCEVVSNREVRFRGAICSLSGSARTIAHEKGFRWRSVRGPQYWKYEGRTLLEIREAGE